MQWCFKNFLFGNYCGNKNLKKSIKFNLKRIRNGELFRKDKETFNKQAIECTDHKYDLNCNLDNCNLHLGQKNAYYNFCEFFFTKPFDRDYFNKDHKDRCFRKSKLDNQTDDAKI